MTWLSKIGRWGRKGLDAVLDGLFPQNCIYCQGDREGGGDFLCGLCRSEIEFIRRPFCNRCGIPADISYDYPQDDFECGGCRKDPFKFDRARSLGQYDSILRQLIHHFKYRRQMGVMTEIASLLQKFFAESELRGSGFYVSPVPLHFKKMKERGFDQSFVIAREVARDLGLPLANGFLRRVRETQPQAKKTKGERAVNIRGAFEVDRPDWVAGKDILLVDDVFTTGATVNEAARILKRAGAARVHVFTLARV